MAATATWRRRLTDAERAERVEALTAELAAAVAALTDCDGPDGLWPALVAMTEAHGFTLSVRPAQREDGGAHGWTDYATRTVWVNSDCDEAERVRILAHETAGHIRCDHEHRPDISRGQRETEADSVAYVVLAAHQLLDGGVRGPTGAAATPTCCGPPPKRCTGWPPRS
jgi:hypothetical protein